MAYQRQIPGGGFLDEAGSFEAQIPGGGFVNATGSGLTAAHATQANSSSAGALDVMVTLAAANAAQANASSADTINVPTGTLTTLPLKNNAGTVWASQTGIVVHIYQEAGPFAVTKTGQTTNASGVLAVTDSAITAGQTYRIIIVLSGGAEGMDKLVAT